MDTALRFKLNFDVDKTHEVARIKELHALINRLEELRRRVVALKLKKAAQKFQSELLKGRSPTLKKSKLLYLFCTKEKDQTL